MSKAAFPFPAELECITATHRKPATFQLRDDCVLLAENMLKSLEISQYNLEWFGMKKTQTTYYCKKLIVEEENQVK